MKITDLQGYSVMPRNVLDEAQERTGEKKRDILGTAAKVTDAVFGGGKVGEAIGAKLGKYAVPKEDRQFYDSTGPSVPEIAGSALRAAAMFTPVGKISGALGGGALANIGAGAIAGYGFDVASSLEKGESGLDVVKPGAGTVIGGAIPAGIEGVRAVSHALPKLLSYTSDVPEKAFDTLLERRVPVTEAIKKGATPEVALRDTQQAVRGLRTSLTKEWQDGTTQIIEEFKGRRIGLGDKALKLLDRVSDDFPIEMPVNPKNMSVKETMDLMKSVNELYSKRAVKESAQGIAVRQFKDFLENEMTSKFGGKGGSVAKLYQNYSSKKGVLDAANDIVKAYSTGKPIQQSTALGRLQALFNENKSAYLDAIIDLEKATGKDLLSTITASKFSQKMPNRLASVSSSGGLNAPKGIMDKALDLLILPLSSPRSAAWIAQNLGSKGAMTLNTPGDVLLGTKVGQKVAQSLSDSVSRGGAGMSTRAIHPDDLKLFDKIVFEKSPSKETLQLARDTLRKGYGMEVPKEVSNLKDFLKMLLQNQYDSGMDKSLGI